MVQQLMVMKQASRSVSRGHNEKGLLDGAGRRYISTSHLDFVISGVGHVVPNRTWLRSPSLPSEDDTRAGSFVTPSTHCSRSSTY
ncbi:hypothetical protein C8Q74DRAFT_1224482 [Fomes fomentarius]|nr:hypothetical protein C8Q74DRAFT_1224482 [Fomes fomentarius]